MSANEEHDFEITYENSVFIDKRISCTAYFLKQRIADREKKGEIEGIIHDYWACLIFIAYWQEASLNYYFFYRTDIKPNPKNFWDMLLCFASIIDWDLSEESSDYKKFKELRDLRNDTAHGKPIVEKKVDKYRGTYAGVNQFAEKLGKDFFAEIFTVRFLEDQYELAERLEKSIFANLGRDMKDHFSSSNMNIARKG